MRRPFSTVQRWPLVLAHAPPERRTVSRWAACAVGLIAVALALVLEGRVAFAPRAVIAVVGALPLFWAIMTPRPAARASGTWIQADLESLSRVSPEGSRDVLRWDGRFGVALLASYGRPTALLAFTTPTETRYVPTRIADRSEADDELLARIAVLADLDLVDALSHDAALTSESAAAIVRHVELHDREALGRVFLSDGHGAPLSLDRETLAVAGHNFDLARALEWRSLMFHESTGQAAALYQATWIRQGGAEVVLVAPMPASIVPRDVNVQKEATGKLGRALTRDLRLLQAPAESPPSRDVRVAIDRPFMLAVRRKLADAPAATRITVGSPRKRSASRDSVA